jgi:hypothetical protein
MVRIDRARLDRRVEEMDFEVAEAHIHFLHLARLFLFLGRVDFFNNLATDYLSVELDSLVQILSARSKSSDSLDIEHAGLLEKKNISNLCPKLLLASADCQAIEP